MIERVVASHLQVCLEEADYLDPLQSGFRPDFGTEISLVAVIAYLNLSMTFAPIDLGVLE